MFRVPAIFKKNFGRTTQSEKDFISLKQEIEEILDAEGITLGVSDQVGLESDEYFNPFSLLTRRK